MYTIRSKAVYRLDVTHLNMQCNIKIDKSENQHQNYKLKFNIYKLKYNID